MANINNHKYIYFSVKCKDKADNLPSNEEFIEFLISENIKISDNDLARISDNQLVLRFPSTCGKTEII